MTTTIQRIAQLFGVVFALIGVVGFVTTGFTMEMRMLLGMFPVNLVHNFVHLLFGIWGLVAARSVSGATGYCRGAGGIYLVLAVLGHLMGGALMNIVPIHGNDIWLHAALGIVLLVAGFTATPKALPAT
jgi:hypothetical protein